MKTTVLIVEDEGLIALDLKKKLERAGYDVAATADCADEALLAAEQFRPDLVLMDIRIKGPRDGIETAELIRNRFRIPVMFVTAHADQETLERARITEPFGYIVKPFHGVDFRPQIEMALWKNRMEQKLRASEAWLAATVANVADALIATGSEGNIVFMNAHAAELTGWDCDAARGMPLLEVFQAFEEATDLPAIHPLEAIYDGRDVRSAPCEYRLRMRDGSTVLVEGEMSANRDQGLLLGIILVFREITARRRAEMQGRRLQTMNSLGLMAAGLGREMAGSQRRMDGLLARLVERSKGESLRMVLEIYDEAAQQQSVIQQLVALGDSQAPTVLALDVNEVLKTLEGEFRTALGPRRTLNLSLQPGAPRIHADPEGLRDALFRLVTEGRDAMPDGGTVEIATSAAVSGDGRQSLRLSIRDTGKGIRENAKERVFDPYYQSRPGNRNAGFSLALVHRFVAIGGGQIEVESAPGGGVHFILTFPAALNSLMPPLPGGRKAAALA